MEEREDVNNDLDFAQDLSNDSSNIDTEAEVVETQAEETEQVLSEESEQDFDEEQEIDQPKKQSKAVPYERFAEINQKAKELEQQVREAEIIKQQNEFYKQQFERMQPGSSQQYLQPQEPQESPESVQAKQVLRELGYVSKDELDQMLAERESAQKAVNTVLQQENALKQKYAGRNLPEASARDLVSWFEAQGYSVNRSNIPDNFLENVYKLRYGDKIESSYASSKPRPAPMARTSAPGIGKEISQDEFFSLPADKTDEYYNALKRTVK